MNKYKEQLLKFGYCVVPNIISKSYIEVLRQLYISLFENKGMVTLKPDEFLKHDKVSNMIFDDNVVNAINEVVGKEFCIYPDFTIRKSLYIPWHTDTSYLSIPQTDSHEYSDMVQMSIYLQDNDIESGGGLEIIPGSHRQKHLDRMDLHSKENKIDYERAIIMPSKAGDLVFWDSRLIHKSTTPKNSLITKLALQWTISKTEEFSLAYINYLKDRVLAKQKHVSDYIGQRESEYLLGIKEVCYPKSFSAIQLEKISKYSLKIKFL